MIKAGAAGVHIEDQVRQTLRTPSQKEFSTDEMCDRIKAAMDAKSDKNFVDGTYRRTRH